MQGNATKKLQPKKLTHRIQRVVDLAANGFMNCEIASMLGYTQHRVSIILNTPRIREAVIIKQSEMFNEETQHISKLIPKALRNIEEILDDPIAKQNTKLDAAKYVTDRKWGRPQQEVKVKSTSLREIVLRTVEKAEAARDVTPKELDEEGKEIANIITDIIPKDVVVGKRSEDDES